MADPDGCHALDGDDTQDTHTVLRDVLILPYLTGDFDDAYMSAYASAVLFAVLMPDGSPRPIACTLALVYRRCFANLACASIRPTCG